MESKQKQCKFCHSEFESKHQSHIFCSRRCGYRYRYHLNSLRKTNRTYPRRCPRCDVASVSVNRNGRENPYCPKCHQMYRVEQKINRVLGAKNHG